MIVAMPEAPARRSVPLRSTGEDRRGEAAGLMSPGGATSLLLGTLTAALGVVLYLGCRSEAPAILVLLGASATVKVPPACSLLPVVGWAPSLVHAAALTLATCAFLPPTRRATVLAGAAWLLVNVAWEVACGLVDGGPSVPGWALLKAIPGTAAGTGDRFDVIAAGLGALLGMTAHAWSVRRARRADQHR